MKIRNIEFNTNDFKCGNVHMHLDRILELEEKEHDDGYKLLRCSKIEFYSYKGPSSSMSGDWTEYNFHFMIGEHYNGGFSSNPYKKIIINIGFDTWYCPEEYTIGALSKVFDYINKESSIEYSFDDGEIEKICEAFKYRNLYK